MRIEIQQLPPVEYSPNWRGHWRCRYEAGRVYQAAVFYECINAMNKLQGVRWQPGFPPFKKPRLDLTFVFPNHRKRDEDNLRARFKPGQDALAQARAIESDTIDNLTMGRIDVEVDQSRAPLTIINLEELNE